MGVHLLKHPEANEEDLHVNQWDPYELSEDGNLVDGITPMQAIQAIIDYWTATAWRLSIPARRLSLLLAISIRL